MESLTKQIEFSEEQYLIPYKCSKETYLQSLQWKIIHGIYPTGTTLKKMKIKVTDLCEYCGEIDTLQHFFFECNTLKCLWKDIERRIERITNTYIHLSAHEVIVGLVNKYRFRKNIIDSLNLLVLVGKATISKVKYRGTKNFLTVFQQELCWRNINL